MSRDIRELQIAGIRVGKYRSRQGPLVVEELSESIREQGLLEPIGVLESNAGYDLVYGERRLAACQKLGMVTVPAVIFTDSRKALLAAFTENLQRQNLSPVEEAGMLKRLLATGMKQTELAKALGKTQSYIAQKLRLEKLPLGVTVLMGKQPNGKLGPVTEGHARQLLRLVHLMNPDINAPEYAENFRMKGQVETNRKLDADGRRTSGALDAVTYYQDRMAWELIESENISVRELEERINQYARTKCTWCLISRPGHCKNCITVGKGFATARFRLKVDNNILPTEEEILAQAKLVGFYMTDEDEVERRNQ